MTAKDWNTDKRLLLGSGGIRTPERQQAWLKEVDRFLGDIRKVLFVPYALKDHDAYTKKLVDARFMGDRQIVGIHKAASAIEAVESCEAIFVGGGNTFRLINELYRNELIDPIRDLVFNARIPYLGFSAGSNAACPELKTTNDMPIVEPPSFSALGLIPFQINPHYFAGVIHYESGNGLVPHAGSTRDERISEFHEMNDVPVLGLWEGSVLLVENGVYSLRGSAGARLFKKATPPVDFQVGTDLTKALTS